MSRWPTHLFLLGVCLSLGLGCKSSAPRSLSRAPDWGMPRSEFASTYAENPRVSSIPLLEDPVQVFEPSERGTTNLATHAIPEPLSHPGPAPVLPARERWQGIVVWCQRHGLAQPTRHEAPGGPAYVVVTPRGSLTIRPYNVLALWDNIEIRLGFAPQMLGGQLYLHRLDLERILQPLATSQPSLSPAGPHLIVIDPGHGGENAGTRSSVTSRYEKVYTLDWARRLGTLLLSNGWQVVLTRSNDRDLALSNRVTMAEFNKADLFISLHFNSAPHDAQQAGLETYYLTPVGMPSTVTRGFLDDASLSFPNNSFDDQNLLWAMRLHRTLVRATGRRDRGVRHARFLGVLRNQRRPAVLIEGGYLSNPQEARLIDQPAYRQQLAEAVAAALGAPGSL